MSGLYWKAELHRNNLGEFHTGHQLDIAPSVTLWVNYIYLDTDERRRFAQVSLEYLIEQLQYQTSPLSSSVKLNFNHPVKQIVWVCQNITANTELDTQSTVPATDILDPSLNRPRRRGDANGKGDAIWSTRSKNDYFYYHPPPEIDGNAITEYMNGHLEYFHFDICFHLVRHNAGFII